MSMMRTILHVLLLMLGFTASVNATDFFVKNTNATGADSFAAAIAAVNAAGSGTHTITFTATVPVGSTITSSNNTLYVIKNSNVTIDASGKDLIFRGSTLITAPYGLTIDNNANNITIKGITFQNFTTSCIRILNGSGIKIQGCRFGTNVTGSADVNTNISYGIEASGASKVVIGGSTVAERNYFSDCSSAAVYLFQCNDVSITANYFGISSSNALYANPNAKGIYLRGCVNTTIGANNANQRNLFAGPAFGTSLQIEISDTGNNNTRVIGNYFGYASNGTTEVGFNNGIQLSNNANNNLIAYNRFASTSANPYNVLFGSTSYIGNKLKQNSFQSHSGNPSFPGMSSNVTSPTIYSTSSTIIKGESGPGDSIEVYYANSYAVSGLTFIAATRADASGKWRITGSFTTGQYVSVTATNNTNNTTSWFTTNASTIYACANTPTTYVINTCNYPTVATNGIFPSGSVGTTTPSNAGQWSSSGTGTFTNGGLFNPSITKYMPSAADLSSGTVTFRLVTKDTNCVNTTAGSSAAVNFIPLPQVSVGTDKYSCSSNVFSLNATPAYYGNSSYYTNWVSLDNPSNVTFSNNSLDNPTATFSAAGTYRILRSVGSLPYYCSSSDTLVVTYKPTPTAPGKTLTTLSQVPVTYTIPSAVGEVLTAFYYAGSASPAAFSLVSTSTTNPNTITYQSTGPYYGAASYSYYVQNQCGGTSTLGTVSINVQNAPPVALNPAPVAAVRGIEDAVVIDLSTIVSDVNNDINFSSVSVFTNPASGATYALNTPSVGFITVYYNTNQRAADFVGLDSLRISIADVTPSYSTARVTIDRQRNLSNPSKDPEDIEVNNAVSPDGDGVNDFMRITFLSDYENTVSIYDRWGSKVWEGKNYNNTTVRFEGNGNVSSTAPLPDGTYFFVIKNESKAENGEKNGLTSGYLVISRQK